MHVHKVSFGKLTLIFVTMNEKPEIWADSVADALKIDPTTFKSQVRSWVGNSALRVASNGSEPDYFTDSVRHDRIDVMTAEALAKYLKRSRNQQAFALRKVLSTKHSHLFGDVDLSYKPTETTRKTKKQAGGKPKPKQKTFVFDNQKSTPKLEEALNLLQKMQDSKLFSKDTLSDLYLELWGQLRSNAFNASPQERSIVKTLHVDVRQLKKEDAEVVSPEAITKNGTQMVPVSNVQASSMVPNFDTIRSFFLTSGMKHPRYQDWIPAEDIAKPMGWTADKVKSRIKELAEQRGHALPNNQAKDLVVLNGGFFRGMTSLVDDTHLPVFVNEKLGGIAVWYMKDDGLMVWRNYWSPDFVRDLYTMIGFQLDSSSKVIEGEATLVPPESAPEASAEA